MVFLFSPNLQITGSVFPSPLRSLSFSFPGIGSFLKHRKSLFSQFSFFLVSALCLFFPPEGSSFAWQLFLTAAWLPFSTFPPRTLRAALSFCRDGVLYLFIDPVLFFFPPSRNYCPFFCSPRHLALFSCAVDFRFATGTVFFFSILFFFLVAPGPLLSCRHYLSYCEKDLSPAALPVGPFNPLLLSVDLLPLCAFMIFFFFFRTMALPPPCAITFPFSPPQNLVSFFSVHQSLFPPDSAIFFLLFPIPPFYSASCLPFPFSFADNFSPQGFSSTFSVTIAGGHFPLLPPPVPNPLWPLSQPFFSNRKVFSSPPFLSIHSHHAFPPVPVGYDLFFPEHFPFSCPYILTPPLLPSTKLWPPSFVRNPFFLLPAKL